MPQGLQALPGVTLRAPYEACDWVSALFIDEETEAQREQGLGHAASEWQDIDRLQLLECSVPGRGD